VTLCAATALALSASIAAAHEPVKVTIGWTPPDITGVFKTATDFFEKSAADAGKHGFEVEVIKPVLAEANKAGIPVIVVNLLEPIEGVNVSSYIGFDNTVGAEVSAYAMLDYFGGPGVLGSGEKVDVAPDQYLDLAFWEGLYKGLSDDQKAAIKARGAIIEGVAGGFFSTARVNGFHQVVDQYPRVEIVGNTCAADWNREKGTRCAEDFLQANPDGLDFIWAASNEMGLGAMLASDAAGRLETAQDGPSVGNNTVAIFTNDVTPESVDRIAEGKIIAETTHGFADWGWFGTAFAVQLACGESPPPTFDIRPRTAYQTNARQFYPDPALPAIDWDKIRADCKKAG